MIYYQDESVTLHHGDSLDVLRTLPDRSVDCCVTSPPYFGLRSYLPDGHPDKAQEQGIERSPAEYVAGMVAVFAEVRRILTDDGCLFLNLGDSYSSGTRTTYADTGKASGRIVAERTPSQIPGKNLLGIPWRVAFALQDDGWILRNDIIWSKPNAMPESVSDRLSTRHEHRFMFSKSRSYWFDLDTIREQYTPQGGMADSFARNTKESGVPGQGYKQHRVDRIHGKAAGTNLAPTGTRHDKANHRAGKNPGDVWSIATQPFAEAHFAVMPPELARRAVVAGCKPGGVVLDPFSGSGTTGLVAQRNGRKYVGIDISADYLDLSLRTRLQQGVLTFDEETA